MCHTSVLQQDSVQSCDWPSYWTQHPEKTPLPARAGRQSTVQGMWSKRGNLGPHSLWGLGLPQTYASGLFFFLSLSLSLEPEDIKSMNLGAIWSLGRVTGLLWFWHGTQRARLKRPRCIGAMRSRTHMQFIHSFINAPPQVHFTLQNYLKFFSLILFISDHAQCFCLLLNLMKTYET